MAPRDQAVPLMQRDPHDPRTPMRPIDEQVTAAISAGFETIIKDSRAQQTEMMNAQKEIVRQLRSVANALAGNTSGKAALHDYARDTGSLFHEDHPGVRAHRNQVAAAPAAAQLDRDPRAVAHQMISDIVGKSGDPMLQAAWARPDTPPSSTILQPNTPADVFGKLDHPNIEMERLQPKDVFVGHHRISGEETRTQLRKRVAMGIANSAESWAYRPVQTEEGGGITTINGQMMRFSHAVHHVDEAGNPFDANGNALNAAEHLIPVAGREAAQVTRRLTMARTAVDASSALAAGEPVGGALAAMIPGGLGLLGGGALAFEGLNKGLEFAQSQIAANRGLQSHYGGSINDQWGDRASQWFNRNITGRFSMLGTENYDELFKGAEENGLRGGRRNDYIRTGADMMMTGASADQTKSIMETALTTGQGLQGLTAAIKSVGNAARDAGVDAAKARDVFMKNYEASSEMLFGAPGAAKNLATMLTNFSTSNGQAYQGVDYTGVMSENTSMANAARLGLTPTQYTAAVRKDPVLAVSESEDNAKRQLNNITGNGGRNFEQWVVAYTQDHPQWDPKVSADLVAIGEFLTDEGGFRPDIVQNILKNNGIQTPIPEQALGIAAKMYTTSSATNQGQAQQKQTIADLTRDPSKVDPGYFFNENDPRSMMSSWNKSLMASVGASVKIDKDNQYGTPVVTSHKDATVAPFPVVTQLHQARNELGIEDPDKQKVRIMANGKEVVVPLSTAISLYPDQLQNGSAVFLGGPNDGKSVAQALSLPRAITQQKATSGDVGASDQFGRPEPDQTYVAKHFQSYEDYQAERDKVKTKADKQANDSGSTKVTLDLTPEAKKILQVVQQSAYDTGQG